MKKGTCGPGGFGEKVCCEVFTFQSSLGSLNPLVPVSESPAPCIYGRSPAYSFRDGNDGSEIQNRQRTLGKGHRAGSRETVSAAPTPGAPTWRSSSGRYRWGLFRSPV